MLDLLMHGSVHKAIKQQKAGRCPAFFIPNYAYSAAASASTASAVSGRPTNSM